MLDTSFIPDTVRASVRASAYADRLVRYVAEQDAAYVADFTSTALSAIRDTIADGDDSDPAVDTLAICLAEELGSDAYHGVEDLLELIVEAAREEAGDDESRSATHDPFGHDDNVADFITRHTE